jgi:hypothetical protein
MRVVPAAILPSVSRTDWQIVKDFFGRYKDRCQARFEVPSANPLVKDRINCVNARLLNHAGQRRLSINSNCKAATIESSCGGFRVILCWWSRQSRATV